MHARSVLLLGLALAAVGSASEIASGIEEARLVGPGKKVVAAPLTPPDRIEISIPYPNAGMYLHRGIYGSFTGGRYATQDQDTATSELSWQDPLFQWQGELGYFYTEWFSAGVGFRIIAGSPNDEQQTVKNRYFLLTRVHKSWPRAAMFLGTRVGVDDVSFTLLSDDTTGVGGRLRESNVGVGAAFGWGWKFSRYAGLTFGQRVDVSLVRQNPSSPHRGLNFMTQPGAAFDLVRVFPSLGDNVKAFYLLSEFQSGQTVTERGKLTRQDSWILGVSMAF
jgi:hypothetical protein